MRNAEVIRQWSVLRELEASRRGTIDGLAQKMAVTTRTIRRDLEALQTAGFPIYDEQVDGKRFWKLDTRPFKGLGDTGFTLSELCALYFSRTVLECLAGTPFQHDLANAFAKFEAILTPRMRQFLDRLPAILQAKGEPKKRRGGKLDDTIARLIDATLRQRQATMRYHSFSSNRTKEYLIEPYRLLYAQGGLYLFAYVPEYTQMRTFAVERIDRLSLLETTFEPTQELALELWAHSLGIGIGQGPPEQVEVEFAASIAPYVREREWHASQRLTECPDGALRLTLEVCIDEALRSWILGFGAVARVVAPTDLATDIAAELERARAGYVDVP
ncbi:MAG: transcriptional regulator [Vicinamibacterales bacterium]|nr:hypothetical protein [Acidobacteriota bacterium]MDP7293691.1 transcriptional regulator [Vicinamibacterales bacterium]MDP7473106.1 transcriptional regulator [Vicinamibacterales bacterium]MDP7671344.1 transcriptional regulator [Vicinamibacterales bacterium]HJO38570.1 transcriptional regulator [Vicinamibacterales bacterium]